jgi:RecQ family ATP-dependent DNA helicase
LKLLYLTPERIAKGEQTRQMLNELYQNEMLARFVIDEAHCVSQWGHDFRKDYAKLGLLKMEFPEVPILALTATARRKVAEDTTNILQIPFCKRFNTGFDRPNLYFGVTEKEGFSIVAYIRQRFRDATGIVYCMTKAECEIMADFLRDNGVTAAYYHAGQPKGERKTVQAAWLQGQIKVVCATIAYGMGIDCPCVRFVVHLSVAKSLEGYYQEAGRAGRDGQYSECIILYDRQDIVRLKNIIMTGKFRLSVKDEDMLEEMRDYCEDKTHCRRKIFYEKFTDKSTTFKRCGSVCDNCKRQNGEELTYRPAAGRSSSSTARSGEDRFYPELKLSGEKKSSIIRNSDSSSTHSSSVPPLRSNFQTASGKSVQLKRATSDCENIIDLNDDDWIESKSKKMKPNSSF